MGIDKSNVRWVIHYTLLFYSYADVANQLLSTVYRTGGRATL